MARFLLSPGVLTREVDNSQYASTQPAGNVAAIVGYAEKGPFEPTIVSGTQEFNRVFGKTLEDAPYLAQAAYKYFSQGQSLLVVRAGSDRDPDLYPQAAQYASKQVRLGERDVDASAGYQAFSRSSSLAAGTFAPGAEFGFRVIADHRAFLEPKAVETWDVAFHETSNSMGQPSPAGDVGKLVVKTAYNKLGDRNFEVNFKEDNLSGSYTEEKAGQGTKTGESFGDTITSTVYSYAHNGTYAENRDSYTYVEGSYRAVALGTVDMQAGYDWAANNEELEIFLDNTTYTITLDLSAADAGEVVSHINTKLVTAVSDSSNIIDLSGDLEAFFMTTASDGTSYVGLRRVGSSVASSSTTGFAISSSDAASTLGLQAKTYSDADTVYGTFHTESDSGIFDGNILLTKKGSVESGVESFQDPIEVTLQAPSSGEWPLSGEASDGTDGIVDQIEDALEAGHEDFQNDPSRATAELSTSGKVRITTKSKAAEGYKAIVRIKNSAANSFIDLVGVDTPVDGQQERPIGEAVITIRAAEKGSYGNKLVLRTETKQVQTGQNSSEDHYNAYVILDGKEVSVYQRVSWTDESSSKFLPKLLENDAYINMDAEDEDGNFVLEQLPDGDWLLGTADLPEGVSSLIANVIDYSVGTNGWEQDQDGVINSMDADFMNALKKIYNPEVYDFNLVCAPGSAASQVQNEIQTLCESRHDCFGIIDAAPFGYGLGVKENLNHVSEINSMNENLNSSYVGAYWPWLQDYDADNKQYVWLPPSIYALTQMVYTDNVADPWYATAGLSRGKVTALDVEYSPTRQERDVLYGESNIINPIVKFVGEGIAIWGQKTAQRTQSALDRINVRRLMIYAEKLIARMARGFLFEQNDAANWAAFARQANAILEPIRQRRGLTTYQVVCDASTNTADLINQNIMSGKIFVQPTKTIEFIEVEFTINAAGEVEFSE